MRKFAVLVAACLTILSTILPGGAEASPILRIGWIEDASGLCPERIQRITGGEAFRGAEEAGNAENGEARRAFMEMLASRGVTPEYFGFSAKPEEMPQAVERLLEAEPHLILVSGLRALQTLLAAKIHDVPVLALTADCTREAAQGTRQDQIPQNYHLFPSQYWAIRLQAFIQYAGVSRLGFILPPDDLPDSGGVASIIVAASNTVVSNEVGVFRVKLSSLGGNACREAVDELFFEEIDALLVDGSGCFESGSDTPSDAEKELWTVLRLRGILPLSLTAAEAARRGALLAPASWLESGENARLGRLAAIFALERFKFVADDDQSSPADGDGTVAAFVGPYFADIPENSRPDGHAPDNPPDNRSDLRTRLAEQPKYSLNLDTAEALSFDPSAALIARITEFVRQQKR